MLERHLPDDQSDHRHARCAVLFLLLFSAINHYPRLHIFGALLRRSSHIGVLERTDFLPLQSLPRSDYPTKRHSSAGPPAVLKLERCSEDRQTEVEKCMTKLGRQTLSTLLIELRAERALFAPLTRTPLLLCPLAVSFTCPLSPENPWRPRCARPTDTLCEVDHRGGALCAFRACSLRKTFCFTHFPFCIAPSIFGQT